MKRQNKKGFAHILLFFLIIALLVAGYFAWNWWQHRYDVCCAPDISRTPASLVLPNNLPVYPGASFWEKKYISGCSEQERSVCWVDAYTWRVSGEGVNKVIDWYTDEQSRNGWKLYGDGGSEGTNRYGYIGKGDEHYWLTISKADLEGTVEIEFRGPLPIK